MWNKKLCIAMMGLPARGKSTVASKLKDCLVKDGIKARVFNNGTLRRQIRGKDSADAAFFAPDNLEGACLREKIALINIERAKRFLAGEGLVALLDATNISVERRQLIAGHFSHVPLLFIECQNDDKEILEASILRKIDLPEFKRLELVKEAAMANFRKRIKYYEDRYVCLDGESNYIQLDSLNNKITREEITQSIPYYDRIRDYLVTDSVRNLFLIRHGETYFNLENRIGGDSPLTPEGIDQAERLARFFKRKKIPVIFTSEKVRTWQTADPIRELQRDCTIIRLKEFNEIDSGVCESMSYEEIRSRMPHVYLERKKDKYHYIYPEGESYATMRRRIDRGVKKALYLSSDSGNVMIVGHRAVNRMILSHFLYRRTEDVPYVYIPQDKFYHIVTVQDKKLFQLRKF